MLFDTSLCIDCMEYYFSYNFCFSRNFKYNYSRVTVKSSFKSCDRQNDYESFSVVPKKKSQMMSQLSSPVWSLLHAAPRNQAALLWLLLYDPIFTFRNGIIFSEGQNNFGPFALVQRHYREHHSQFHDWQLQLCRISWVEMGEETSAWSGTQAGLRREHRRDSRSRSHISVGGKKPWFNS